MTTTTADTDLIRARLLDGWRVESTAQGTTILAKGRGKPCRHGAHLLMCAITVGLWLPFYGLCTLKAHQRRTRRVAIYTDDSGAACEVSL